MPNLYLYILLASISFPFVFSFHPRIAFYKTWKHLIPSIVISASIFIAWDIAFTDLKIWGFNLKYVTGNFLFNLPIEEVLFFIFIPFSSLFIYHIVENEKGNKVLVKTEKYITNSILIFSLIMSILYYNKTYTFVTFISLFIFLSVIKYYFKVTFLGNFYFSYLFILIPFFIVNGILTGSFIEGEVVWYDNTENMNFRMGTIPFEDTFYGMLLFLLILSINEFFSNKRVH